MITEVHEVLEATTKRLKVKEAAHISADREDSKRVGVKNSRFVLSEWSVTILHIRNSSMSFIASQLALSSWPSDH